MNTTIKIAIAILVLTIALVAQTNGILGILLTGVPSGTDYPVSYFVGNVTGGEAPTPITCTVIQNPPPNSCFWTGGMAGTTYFFKAAQVLTLNGQNYYGPMSNEVIVQFPSPPGIVVLSGVPAIAVTSPSTPSKKR